MNTASHFSSHKIFSTFFKIPKHFTFPYVVVFMGRKKLWKRGLSAGLALLMATSVAFSPLPEGIFATISKAAEKTFPLVKSDLALGMNVIPKALAEEKGIALVNLGSGPEIFD